MLGLFALLSLIVWAGLALMVGGFLHVFFGRRRWVFVVGTLVCLFAPLWDVIPGKILFDKAARDLSGTRVNRVVKNVEGYLDQSKLNCDGCGQEVVRPWFAYSYFEMQRTERRPILDKLTNFRYSGPDDQIGFYQYRIGKPGSRECANFKVSGVPEKRIRPDIQPGSCIYSTRSEKPLSEYKYEETLVEVLVDEKALWNPIRMHLQRISRVADGDVLAQAVKVHYHTWACRIVPFFPCMYWVSPDPDQQQDISLQKVLIPKFVVSTSE